MKPLVQVAFCRVSIREDNRWSWMQEYGEKYSGLKRYPFQVVTRLNDAQFPQPLIEITICCVSF